MNKIIEKILSGIGLASLGIVFFLLAIGIALLANFIPAGIAYLILVVILKFNIKFYVIYWISFLIALFTRPIKIK